MVSDPAARSCLEKRLEMCFRRTVSLTGPCSRLRLRVVYGTSTTSLPWRVSHVYSRSDLTACIPSLGPRCAQCGTGKEGDQLARLRLCSSEDRKNRLGSAEPCMYPCALLSGKHQPTVPTSPPEPQYRSNPSNRHDSIVVLF